MRYGFTREPTGSAYQELVEFCRSRSVVATLVIRELDWLEEEAILVMERLRPFQIETAERSEWAGTRLIGHTATVYSYRVDEALVRARAEGLTEASPPITVHSCATPNADFSSG